MASINKVMLIGHLGKNPELRYMSTGDAMASFSLATSESWKDKQTGEKKEKVEWHQITAFRKLGEICGNFLKKGSLIYCEGKLKTEKYTDKDGISKNSTKIIIDKMEMLGGCDYQNHTAKENAPTQPAPDFDDDIPF